MNNSYRKKTRRQKGGNLFQELDELINLAIPTSMEQPGANNRLQDKYEEIMREIPNTNEEQLRQSYEEIYLMTTPNRDGFIPINFYDEALSSRLEEIKSKICERIDCNEQNGGKKKRNNKKKRTRRKKGGNEEGCPICMEKINNNERLTTNCNHNFHRQCFIKNCLAELNKGNFDAREEEDEVFQCPNCRGNTKEECLSDPEVRSIYEEKKREYENRIEEDSDDEDYPNMFPGSRNEEYGNLKETLKSDLGNTISKIYEDPNGEEGEIEEFLTDLHSNLQEFDYELGSIELQDLNKMLDDIIDEKAIDLNIDLDNLKEGIKREIEDFEQHQEGGKRRRRKQKGCKKKKSKKVKRKGGGIGSSKPTIPPIKESVNKTRKSISFSPSTKQPNSPKPNKKKEIFISKNKKKQKAVTQYENRQSDEDLRDMMLGKLPLKGGNKYNKTKKRKGGTTTQGFGFKGLNFNKTTGNKYWKTNSETGKLEAHDEDCYGVGKLKWCKRK